MKRYEAVTTAAQQTPTLREPSAFDRVLGAIVYSVGASLAILAAGAIFLLAADRLTWTHYRFAVLLASVPAGIVGALIAMEADKWDVQRLLSQAVGL